LPVFVMLAAATLLAACAGDDEAAASNDITPAAGPVAAVPPPMAAPKEEPKPAPIVAHVASYTRLADAMRGWAKLRLQYKDMFAKLEPRTSETQVLGRTYTRLLASGFTSDEEARRFCDWAKSVKLYCVLLPLQGAPLKTI
jgi:hypothetical protein